LLLLLFLLFLLLLMMTRDDDYDDAWCHSIPNAVCCLKHKKLKLYRALKDRLLREVFEPERRKY
jgi:hypothetical protein